MMVHIIRIPHDLSTVTSYYLHTPASSLSCFDCAAGNVAGVVVVDVTIVADDTDDFNDRRQKYLPASFCNNHYLLPPSLSLSLSLSLTIWRLSFSFLSTLFQSFCLYSLYLISFASLCVFPTFYFHLFLSPFLFNLCLCSIAVLPV